MTELRALVALLLLVVANGSAAPDEASTPVKGELQLIYLFEGPKPEYLFVIGQSGFRSIAALKEHLKTWPRGSELRWAPGCERLGDEPLLSSEQEMEAFRAFLRDRGITFVLVPSG